MRKLYNILWYVKRFNIKVSNFINFVCYFNFVPCLQFTAEASLLQELNVKWKQQVNQRDAELYTKYGGALDLEVWNFLFFSFHVHWCLYTCRCLCRNYYYIVLCMLSIPKTHWQLSAKEVFFFFFFIICDHFFHFLVTFLFWISIELEVNFNIRTVSQL